MLYEQVPEWLVEVRHDSTHGTMPSLNILRYRNYRVVYR
jgi:hypothetical protein